MLEVTLSGRAYDLVGDNVSGSYFIENETKSKDDPCWKKDDDDIFIFRSILGKPTFLVCSGKSKGSIMSNTQV